MVHTGLGFLDRSLRGVRVRVFGQITWVGLGLGFLDRSLRGGVRVRVFGQITQG